MSKLFSILNACFRNWLLRSWMLTERPFVEGRQRNFIPVNRKIFHKSLFQMEEFREERIEECGLDSPWITHGGYKIADFRDQWVKSTRNWKCRQKLLAELEPSTMSEILVHRHALLLAISEGRFLIRTHYYCSINCGFRTYIARKHISSWWLSGAIELSS